MLVRSCVLSKIPFQSPYIYIYTRIMAMAADGPMPALDLPPHAKGKGKVQAEDVATVVPQNEGGLVTPNQPVPSEVSTPRAASDHGGGLAKLVTLLHYYYYYYYYYYYDYYYECPTCTTIIPYMSEYRG